MTYQAPSTTKVIAITILLLIPGGFVVLVIAKIVTSFKQEKKSMTQDP